MRGEITKSCLCPCAHSHLNTSTMIAIQSPSYKRKAMGSNYNHFKLELKSDLYLMWEDHLLFSASWSAIQPGEKWFGNHLSEHCYWPGISCCQFLLPFYKSTVGAWWSLWRSIDGEQSSSLSGGLVSRAFLLLKSPRVEKNTSKKKIQNETGCHQISASTKQSCLWGNLESKVWTGCHIYTEVWARSFTRSLCVW